MSYTDTIQDACPKGKAWAIEAGIQSDAEAWQKLHRVDWMLWLIRKRGVKLDVEKLRRFIDECAALVPDWDTNLGVERTMELGSLGGAIYTACLVSTEAAKASVKASKVVYKEANWDNAWHTALAMQADRLRKYFKNPFEEKRSRERKTERKPTPINGRCCYCGYSGAKETKCEKSPDGVHCEDWWDGCDD
jgi:hypothetical protein